MRISILTLLLAFIALPLVAQSGASRYDLGRRVRAMEEAWAKADDEAKKRALPELQQAVRAFFARASSRASTRIDAARFALEGREPEALERALIAHLIEPSAVLVAPGAEVTLSLKSAYAVEGVKLEKQLITWRLASEGSQEPLLEGMTTNDSFKVSTETEGDHRVEATLSSGGQEVALASIGISVLSKVKERCAALVEGLDEKADLQATSLRSLASRLEKLVAGRDETDLPAHRLLIDAEAAHKDISEGRAFWGPQRAGDHWLAYKTRRGQVNLRCWVPKPEEGSDKRPLVLALHGAGGSENMFFDAYGAGLVVDLCRARGWYLMAPRLAMFGGAKLETLLDEALKLLPDVDPSRVFVVGHSMGAARGQRLAERSADRLAAFAALGGGRKSRRAAEMNKLPVYVGAGAEDFGRAGAEALHASLVSEDSATRKLRIFEGIEHLAIVQEALPEVFAFFDAYAVEKR